MLMTGICRFSLLAGLGIVACGGSPEQGPLPGPSTGGQNTATAGTTSTTAGASGSSVGTAGSGVGGSGTAGGTATAGMGGTPSAGSGGAVTGGSSGSGSGGAGDPLDTPATHTLNIQAAAAEHLHKATGIPGMPNGMPTSRSTVAALTTTA